MSVYFKLGFLILVTYVVGTHCNCPIEAIPMCTYNICQLNKLVFFTIIFFFHKLLKYFSMFQCHEHVEMNKVLYSLACTWMTIIDSQFYIIDSLSLHVTLELNAKLVVAWLYFTYLFFFFFFFSFVFMYCLYMQLN